MSIYRLNRRGLVGALIGGLGAAVADPERLLWTPGRKLISIPAPARRGGEFIRNATGGDFLVARLIWEREMQIRFTWALCQYPTDQMPLSRSGESCRSYIDRTLKYAPDPYLLRAFSSVSW